MYYNPHITLDLKGYVHILYYNYSAVEQVFYQRTLHPVGPADTPPQISGEGDKTKVWGTTIPDLTYTVQHQYYYSGKYILYSGSTPVCSGKWSNNSIISISLASWDIGIYNLTLHAEDGQGLYDTYSHKLLIVPPSPVITHPADFNHVLGGAAPRIIWRVTSAYYSNGTYQLFLNGSITQNGIWSNSTELGLTIQGLDQLGTANITLQAIDPYGNIISDTVIVEVQAPPGGEVTILVIAGTLVAVAVMGAAVYLLKIRKP